MYIDAVQCTEGEALSLFFALIDFPAPNLIFIQIFTYLHEASQSKEGEKFGWGAVAHFDSL